jgi:hypothetical protein
MKTAKTSNQRNWLHFFSKNNGFNYEFQGILEKMALSAQFLKVLLSQVNLKDLV